MSSNSITNGTDIGVLHNRIPWILRSSLPQDNSRRRPCRLLAGVVYSVVASNLAATPLVVYELPASRVTSGDLAWCYTLDTKNPHRTAKSDICRSHRAGRLKQIDDKNTKIRIILVRFTSYRSRNAVYTARKKRNPVFISEDLTAVRNNLLFKAKRHRDAGIFKYAWSRDGTIKVMLQSGAV